MGFGLEILYGIILEPHKWMVNPSRIFKTYRYFLLELSSIQHLTNFDQFIKWCLSWIT